MSETVWKPIALAPRGVGQLLLRVGSTGLDPVFVGAQADSGKWFLGDEEVHPRFWAEIPAFDYDNEGAAQ